MDEENLETEPAIENSQSIGQKYWSKNWFQIVPPKYVLVKRGIFGSIKAVVKELDVPSDKKIKRTECVTDYEIRGGEDKQFQSKNNLLVDLSDNDLAYLISYYEKTSRNNYLAIANAEKIYREKVREFAHINGIVRDADIEKIYKNREHLELVSKHVADLIADPLTTLYERLYPMSNSDVNKIKRTKAKRGLKLRFPFEQMMLISTAERKIETVKVSLLEQREVSFDVDPVISVVDPKTYVEKLQSEDYHLDENLLFKDIGSRVNSIFSNYFSSRGTESFSKMDSGQMASDQDLCWDLTLLGMEFGIHFHLNKFRVKRYNTEEVLAAVSFKDANKIKLDAIQEGISKYVAQGVDPTVAAMMANGDKDGLGKIDFNAILAAGFMKNGFGGVNATQQTQTAPTTKSGMTLEQLNGLGLCEPNGAMQIEDIDFILNERGLLPGSLYILANDLTQEEVYKVMRKKRGRGI